MTVEGKAPGSAAIFGGSGFIGTHLARHLMANDCDVTTIDIQPRHDNLDCRHKVWDVRSPIPTDIAQSPDVIFNLAAVHRTPGHPDREYYETNVSGALHVAQWADAIGAGSVCFASSIAVYGPGEGTKVETSPLSPVSPYGVSKMMAEQIHLQWAAQDPDRRLSIVRPAVIFGVGEEGNFTRLAGALRQRRFILLGRDDTIKACGYVRDLVRALVFSVSQPSELGTFNFCYPETITIRDVCEAFHDVAGYRLPMMLPKALVDPSLKGLRRMRVTSFIEQAERMNKVITSTNIEPHVLRSAGFEWDTDLRSGVAEWYEECGSANFR